MHNTSLQYNEELDSIVFQNKTILNFEGNVYQSSFKKELADSIQLEISNLSEHISVRIQTENTTLMGSGSRY